LRHAGIFGYWEDREGASGVRQEYGEYEDENGNIVTGWHDVYYVTTGTEFFHSWTNRFFGASGGLLFNRPYRPANPTPSMTDEDFSSFLDGTQACLDAFGLIPGLGEPADLFSAVISAGRGDGAGVLMSAGAMLPLGGQAFTAGKLGKKAANLLQGEGAVDLFKNLPRTKGDNLTGHHIPSAHHMSRYGVDRGDGVSIMMEQPPVGGRHRQTFTYGSQADYNMTARDALAAGIRDGRKIYMGQKLYTPYMRQQFQQVIRMNKKCHPKIFKKLERK
jgi:hypothetical protein